MRYILRARPGHDQLARHRVRRRGRDHGGGAEGIRARSSRSRAGSSTIPRRSGRPSSPWRGKRWRAPASRRRTSPRSASPISAKPRWSGIARPGRRSHNAIVWQDRRTAGACDALRARGLEQRISAEDRAGARRLLLRDQARLDARQRARARARARRRASSRSAPSTPGSIWKLSGGAAHVTDREQRLAHAALRHPHRRRGTRSCSSCSIFPLRLLPQVRASSGGCARHRGRPVPGPHPHRRHGGRPAGGAVRPALHRARAW